MELIRTNKSWAIVDLNEKIKLGSWCIWHNKFEEKVRNIGDGWVSTTGGVRNLENSTLKVVVACDRKLANMGYISTKGMSRIIIRTAHRNLTKYKKEYAPNAHEIQEEIDRMDFDVPIQIHIDDLIGFETI